MLVVMRIVPEKEHAGRFWFINIIMLPDLASPAIPP